MSINRRQFIAGAAASVTAISAADIALAKAPMLGPAGTNYRRIKLGSFEVTVLTDGTLNAENPQEFFATDQDVATVDAFMERNLLPPKKMSFTYFPVLINTGEEVVLVDTGNGARAPTLGKLQLALADAGYTPDQIDVVVITHMHPDHIGGTMIDGKPAFPNARYVTGGVEYDFFTNDKLQGSPLEGLYQMTKNLVSPFAEKMTFVKPGMSIAPGIEAMDLFGHTPGHLGIRIESEGKQLVLMSDAATHFAISLQHPTWESKFDYDKKVSAATRMKLFDMLAAEKIPFSGYHMPFPALGYVEASGGSYQYVPVSFQFSV